MTSPQQDRLAVRPSEGRTSALCVCARGLICLAVVMLPTDKRNLLAGEASKGEIAAVLEWSISDPPPFPQADIDRITTAALSDATLSSERRADLLLRRSLNKYSHADFGEFKHTVQDLHDYLLIRPDDIVAQCYLLTVKSTLCAIDSPIDNIIDIRVAAADLVNRHPEHYLVHFTLGNINAYNHDGGRHFPAALRYFSECLRLNPDFGPGYAQRGGVYFELNEFSKAQQDIDRALTYSPGLLAEYYMRVRLAQTTIYITIGENRKALKLLPRLCQDLKRRPTPWILLWMAALSEAKPATAMHAARHLISEYPTLPEGYSLAAISLSLEGDDAAATEMARKACEVGSTGYSPVWATGRVHEAAHRWKQATQAYSTMFLNTLDKGVYYFDQYVDDAALRCALLYAAAPDTAAREGIAGVRLAKSLVEKYDSSPGRWAALAVLACAYAELGDFEEAVSVMSQIKMETVEPDMRIRYEKLKLQFQKKQPYRLNSDATPNFFDIPKIGCYVGIYKKTSASSIKRKRIPLD